MLKNSEKHKKIQDCIQNDSMPNVLKTDHNELLSDEEIGLSLKQMKSNKTPGLDGLPADFLKTFWRRLKYFLRNAVNSCFIKGILQLP